MTEATVDCVPPCEGVFGPQLLSPVSMKGKFVDRQLDGVFEQWSANRRGRAGDFNLNFGQSIDPSTETVRVSFSENDGSNSRRLLGEFVVEPDDWKRCRVGSPDPDDENCVLTDPTELLSDPDGVRKAVVKEKGSEVKYKFLGKQLGNILKPLSDRIRICVHVGDDAGSGILACEERSGGRVLKCDSTN
jgi:hypothetical protein